MKIAIGSKNPIKIKAAITAFQKVFPQEKLEVIGVEVISEVSNQPMSDKESIKGAETRARKAISLLQADYGVGMEGGLQEIDGMWFDCGWIVIIDKFGDKGIGSSGRIHTPKKIMDLIHQGLEIGHANDLLFQKKNSKESLGHFGLMT